MHPGTNAGQVYLCPMHPEVRQATFGKCPKCNMDLLPEGARFGMLRHMSGMLRRMIRNPVLLIIMVVIMLAAMAMMLM